MALLWHFCDSDAAPKARDLLTYLIMVAQYSKEVTALALDNTNLLSVEQQVIVSVT